MACLRKPDELKDFTTLRSISKQTGCTEQTNKSTTDQKWGKKVKVNCSDNRTI